jgi:hypothetical protein
MRSGANTMKKTTRNVTSPSTRSEDGGGGGGGSHGEAAAGSYDGGRAGCMKGSGVGRPIDAVPAQAYTSYSSNCQLSFVCCDQEAHRMHVTLCSSVPCSPG